MANVYIEARPKAALSTIMWSKTTQITYLARSKHSEKQSTGHIRRMSRASDT